MSVPRSADEIRSAFLEFFEEHDHRALPGSPLVPPPGLGILFTNAGMNQFTDALLGLETRPYSRAVTSQLCMRVSGKQNDLHNVGPSNRHQTLFEMLGNFSFGDYFKAEAIRLAWGFVTKVLQLPPDRLWATVFEDDDEAARLWESYLPPERILRFDEKENFWSMGETGPCGPCSEIFYYRGPLEAQDGSGVNVDDEYLEIWNLVFMQFDRDEAGHLTPLAMQSIDTGMGLERISQVMQGVTSNYETDLFAPLLDRIQELLGHDDEQRGEHQIGYRIIADHVRAATNLIADGVVPGNEGRAYVLRLILRRALRFGKMIGFEGPFMGALAETVIEMMGDTYPQLRERREFVVEALGREEEAFQRTLDRGIRLLDELMASLTERGERTIPGDEVFKLYSTYGFPYDLTADIATEQGFEIDREGFDTAMAEERARARAGRGFDADQWRAAYRRLAADLPSTEFLGYDYASLSEVPVRVVGIVEPDAGEQLDEAETGAVVDLLLDRTPFYAESGGQVADTGVIETEYGRARVQAVERPLAEVIAHRATIVSGTIRRGEPATASIDETRRWDIMRNHTATHLLHHALRDTLGAHAEQRGSLVAPDYLRFDFNHLERLSPDELEAIERAVNEQIRADLPVTASEMGLTEAQSLGAMMLFGEKYGDQVRVISIGDERVLSRELCGGTHLDRTGQIGSFMITGEGSISAGTRRISAVTGRAAEELVREQRALLERVARRVGAQRPEQLEERVERLQSELDEHAAALARLERRIVRDERERLLGEAQEVDGTRLVAARVEARSKDALREMSDYLRDRLGSVFVLLGAEIEGRPLLVAAATPDLVERGAHAGNLVREVAKQLGGGGGGRPDLAEAGGRDAAKLDEALASATTLLRGQLA